MPITYIVEIEQAGNHTSFSVKTKPKEPTSYEMLAGIVVNKALGEACNLLRSNAKYSVEGKDENSIKVLDRAFRNHAKKAIRKDAKMICDNYEPQQQQCRYYEALRGTGASPPTGMYVFSGRCKVRDNVDEWYDVEDEACNMLDWVNEDE